MREAARQPDSIHYNDRYQCSEVNAQVGSANHKLEAGRRANQNRPQGTQANGRAGFAGWFVAV
jgi:hypothetical protein